MCLRADLDACLADRDAAITRANATELALGDWSIVAIWATDGRQYRYRANGGRHEITLEWADGHTVSFCGHHSIVSVFREAARWIVEPKGSCHDDAGVLQAKLHEVTLESHHLRVELHAERARHRETQEERDAFGSALNAIPNDGRGSRCGVRVSGDQWCCLTDGHAGRHRGWAPVDRGGDDGE